MRAYSEREGGEYDRRVEQSLLKKKTKKKTLNFYSEKPKV